MLARRLARHQRRTEHRSEGFTATLEPQVESRIGFRKLSELQVGVESTDPGIEEVLTVDEA